MKKSGLLVYVYRWNLEDCTNGGITSKVDKIILVGENIPKIFEVGEGKPYLELETSHTGYIKAVPRNFKQNGEIGGMFGGNFVYSSDSRFPSKQPIPVHDRFETQEMYNFLSR
jgi:hypothetical protein